jgi:hypothetical protein
VIEQHSSEGNVSAPSVLRRGSYGNSWRFLDVAPAAAIGIKPDIQKFAQTAALSAFLLTCLAKVNACFGSCADLHDPSAQRLECAAERMGWMAPAPPGVSMRHNAGVIIC